MIWLTWRQFRAGAAMMCAALAALAALLAVTGPGLADDYSSGLAECGNGGRDCSEFVRRFFDDNQVSFLAGSLVVLVLPALIGLFWGAPLIARELEAGTHLLVWNQGITRRRWLAIKLGLTGLAAMTAAGLGSLAVTWWAGPLDKSASAGFLRLEPLVFGARGIVPIGYAAFAFALGVTVGMLVRRTLPAMAITLAVFVAVQIAMPLLVRPHLLPPTRTTAAITLANLDGLFSQGSPTGPVIVEVNSPDPAAWVLTNKTVDASGRAVEELRGISVSSGACAPRSRQQLGPDQECMAEIARLGYRQRLVYQPGSRYWPLQWYETGIYAVLALGLSACCFWLIRRRLS